MTMSPRPSVIFDLDGTLVDSAPDLHACINALMAEMGLPLLGLAQVTSFIGEGIPPLVERSLAAVGGSVSKAVLDDAVARYKAIYATSPAALTLPYAGVRDCLARLAERQTILGVCTNKAEALARQVISAVGLSERFTAIVGGDTLPVRKPDPGPLLHAIAACNARQTAAIYVGDSEIDAATAKAAGIPFVLFTRGYRKASIEAIGAAAVFDDFELLPELLGRVGETAIRT